MPSELFLHGVLELNKNNWLSAFQFPFEHSRACIGSTTEMQKG
jgi:hypothetical protein